MWTYPVKRHAPKIVYHRCGCPLLAEVLAHMGPVTPFPDGGVKPIPGESILVNYRDFKENGEPGLIVNQCPRCQGVLKLWWHVEPSSGAEVAE
jgi:hypothetical protein